MWIIDSKYNTFIPIWARQLNKHARGGWCTTIHEGTQDCLPLLMASKNKKLKKTLKQLTCQTTFKSHMQPPNLPDCSADN